MEEIYDLEREARNFLDKANVIQEDLYNNNYQKYEPKTEEEKRAVFITVMKMRQHNLKDKAEKKFKEANEIKKNIRIEKESKARIEKEKREKEEKEKREKERQDYLKTKNGRIELAIKLEEKAFSYLEQAKRKGETKANNLREKAIKVLEQAKALRK